MNNTKIEWCDSTWNPITGCTPISEGCANCYARRMANRLRGRHGYPDDDPFRVTFHLDRLGQPAKWRKPRKIFVCSMGDLFHEDVEYENQRAIFEEACVDSQHTFMFLTKRPYRMTEFMWDFHSGAVFPRAGRKIPWLPPNIWLGVTAENQARADERVPELLKIPPAAVRYVSLEPLLGPVDLQKNCFRQAICPECGDVYPYVDGDGCCMMCGIDCELHLGVDWVIVGGETGPGARPMDPDWARSIRDQCAEAGVPFFMKKMSGGKNPPPDLMIRQFPEVSDGSDRPN